MPSGTAPKVRSDSRDPCSIAPNGSARPARAPTSIVRSGGFGGAPPASGSAFAARAPKSPTTTIAAGNARISQGPREAIGDLADAAAAWFAHPGVADVIGRRAMRVRRRVFAAEVAELPSRREAEHRET